MAAPSTISTVAGIHRELREPCRGVADEFQGDHSVVSLLLVSLARGGVLCAAGVIRVRSDFDEYMCDLGRRVAVVAAAYTCTTFPGWRRVPRLRVSSILD